MTEVVHWTVQANVREGQLDALRELAAEMIADTKANEPGAQAYEWMLSEDGTTCHLYERYRDPAATLQHLANFNERYAARFMSVLEPTGFVVYGNPNDDVRAALEAWGPRYVPHMDGFARL